MTSTTIQAIDWEALAASLSGIEMITAPAQVAKLSEDYYSFSPVLQTQLTGKTGDLVVRPTTEAEVLQVAAACVKFKLPLTVRGAGTGNYGQAVPLQGGVILDTTRMNAIHWIKPGLACVQPGVKLATFDRQAQAMGWELRMAPSTYRTATIGGFIAGGSGGIGSILYGQLRDRGNLQAVRVVTLEDQPQVITLRGDEVQKVNHAYGTNGIITELEIPLGPAYPWVDCVVTFTDFMTSARFGQALANADGIIKKLISIHAWPIPSYFTALRSQIQPGAHCALLMVAESSVEPLACLVQAYGGTLVYRQDANKKGMLLEFTWNHTTLHARNVDSSLTYLQSLFPADNDLRLVEQMYHHYGDEVMMHLEFIRVNGAAIPAGLQVVRYTTAERLQEIIQHHEAQGILIANPHTYVLEDGGRKSVDPEQLQFKQQVDPHGLLNPGKMRAWLERKTSSPLT